MARRKQNAEIRLRQSFMVAAVFACTDGDFAFSLNIIKKEKRRRENEKEF